MLTKMPTFNLRDFMAHLAPGAYCVFQFALLLSALACLVFPDALNSLGGMGKLDTVTGALVAFFIISMCYFVGVVIRLRPA